MKTFVTSDIHFNHANIIVYCPERGNSVEAMNERIIANWNEVVSYDDNVYILGDVAMGKIDLAPKLIRRLNGNKILIRGNHDKSLSRMIKESSSMEFADLFSDIRDYKEITHKVDGKKYHICMSHFPFASWNGQQNGSMMLHGHLHSTGPSKFKGRIKDVGMDGNDLRPNNLDDIVRKLAKIEVKESHHHPEG